MKEPIASSEKPCCDKCRLPSSIVRTLDSCKNLNCPCHRPTPSGEHTNKACGAKCVQGVISLSCAGWRHSFPCPCKCHTPTPSASWEEELRSLWQTTRENQGKYQKVKELISSLLSSVRESTLLEVEGCVDEVLRGMAIPPSEGYRAELMAGIREKLSALSKLRSTK